MKKIMLFAFLAAMCRYATAAPGYYFVSIYGVEGQASIDYKYWATRPATGSSISAPADIGVGYVVTSRWYTELHANYFRAPGQNTSYAGVSTQNDVLLTQGEYPFDLAIHTNIEQYSGAGYGLEVGPVFQTNISKTQFNANLFLQRDYRIDRAAPTQLVYQWQIRQHWKPLLNYGIQGFGEVGQWNRWDASENQGYRAGPALFGSWQVTKTQELKYEAAYLIGRAMQRNTRSFTTRLQYVF